MSLNAAQLYALLPAIYRTRDAENGGPLQALFSIIAAQGCILEDNIRQLYDDQFIETCAPWVIPYIGDLVGDNTVYEIDGATSGRRAEVANTLGYRRRKGTLMALEQVAMDVSGLPAMGVEFFKRLITSESMHDVRPCHAATADLRRGLQLEGVDSAFDTLNRTVDVRRIAPRIRMVSDPDPTPLDINLHGGGRFNIPDVGVYLWRWQPFQVTQARPFQVDALRYRFSPLGQDMPLFNNPPTRASFSRLTTRLDVPQPILRREFYKNLQDFYGSNNSVALYDENGVLIPESSICCRDLGDCCDSSWNCTPSGMVAIDPVLGRIQIAPDYIPMPKQLQVTYTYGFPAEMGGGPYDRSANLQTLDSIQFDVTWVVEPGPTPTLEAAITAWNGMNAGTLGRIVLPGFATCDVNLTGAAAIQLPAESQLWILAGQPTSPANDAFIYDGCFSVLRGNIDIQAPPLVAGANVPPAGQLSISGVWIAGAVKITGGAANVQLMDCTLVPGIALDPCGKPVQPGEPSILACAAEATLSLTRCITGPIGVAEGGTTRICSCIVDSGSPCSVAYAAEDMASQGGDLHIEESTVIGRVHVRTLTLASNTIFMARRARHDTWKAALWCSRQQSGCVRFCFLPYSAITPQQFHCLPPQPSQEGLFEPQFVILRYGHPSYGLLSGDTPMAIWTGADNNSQMGVYYALQETEAVRNVQLRAQEYVPFGLETGVFLVPSRPVIRLPKTYGHGYGLQGNPWNPCGGAEEDDLRFVGIGATLI